MRDTSNADLQPHWLLGAGRLGSGPQAAAPHSPPSLPCISAYAP